MATKKPTSTSSKPSSPEADVPTRLVVKRIYGFIDEAGVHRQWLPGHEVTEPVDVALLIARKAPVEPK